MNCPRHRVLLDGVKVDNLTHWLVSTQVGDDGGDAAPVVRAFRAGTAEEEGVQRRQRVVALALRWWARVAVVEERLAVLLVNSRRDGQVLLAPRYLVGRHGDDDAVADDGTCAGIGT